MNNANTDTDYDLNEGTREIHPAVITWALAIGLIVAFAVTASSFKLSFATLYDLAAMAGLRDSAWVIPVVLDGPILAAGIFRIALSQHTDRATVIGRRFIVAVFALAGLASMAGNAYHAVLTVIDLNAAVAAAIGALAPLMVMTMSEMMAIAISAPRRRVTTTGTTAFSDDVLDETAATEPAEAPVRPKSPSAETDTGTLAAGIDEDLDNGLLKPAVWTSVDLYLTQPEWSLSDIARHLGLHTSTVSRHVKTWTQVQQKIARERSTTLTLGDQQDTADHLTGYDHENGHSDDAECGSAHEYAPSDSDRDYVGAVR